VSDFDQLDHDAQLAVLLDLAIGATRHYSLPGELSVSLINLSENATFAVQAPDGRRWALRVHRDGYHSRAAIASELAWLQSLRDDRVVVTPVPVPGRDGGIIQVVGDPRMRRPRHVVLSEWESGVEPGIDQDLARPFATLGEVAARMHRHARDWQRPSWFTRPTWDFHSALGETAPHWGRWRDGIGVTGEIAALFGRTVDLIGRRLAAYGQPDSRFGLVHCDMRLANLLIDGDAVKVIDFDDCGFSWRMYDAATPVSFHEHEPQVPDLIEAWKAGYRRVLPLSAADEAEIATFVMLRRLLLIAWIGSHAETDLARSMGLAYTEGAAGLCDAYLTRSR